MLQLCNYIALHGFFMTKIKIENLPPNISRQRFEDKISSLKKMSFFAGVKQITLSYLGGITNHGLKDDERNVFIRIPGENSDLLIDRDAELDTLRKLASNGLYPFINEAYSQGELKACKIEPFIEGETLQFDTFYLHQQHVLPSLKQLHDSGIQFANEFNIFARLNLMYETLLFNNISTVPYVIDGHLSSMPIEEIKQYIDELQEKKSNLFPYEIELSPCHNDITPTNFIKLKYPVHGRAYQMIDWEYAGMNDKMYDVAMLAVMLGLTLEQQTPFVLNYFDSTNSEQYKDEIKRVKFYSPLVKLYYGLWAALQVAMCNESTSIDELRAGWGPQSISIFLEQYRSTEYQTLLSCDTQIMSMYK